MLTYSPLNLNSLRPDDAYMRHGTWLAMIHVMACCLFGAKSLPESMMTYGQLDPWEQSLVNIFIEIKTFSLTKLQLKILSARVVAICPGRNVLKKFQWHLTQNATIFIQGNGYENAIYQMAFILSQTSFWSIQSLWSQLATNKSIPKNGIFDGLIIRYADYRKVSNIRRTLVGNKIVDHSDVVGASPVGAAPTTSSFST